MCQKAETKVNVTWHSTHNTWFRTPEINAFLQWYAKSFQIVLKEENIICMVFIAWYFVGNKAKGGISKRVFQENKARQNFRKTHIFTPWYAHDLCFRTLALSVGNLSWHWVAAKLEHGIELALLWISLRKKQLFW